MEKNADGNIPCTTCSLNAVDRFGTNVGISDKTTIQAIRKSAMQIVKGRAIVAHDFCQFELENKDS